MAKDKFSFILYADLIHTVDELKDHQAGKLFKHILKYVNDLNPVTDDKLIKIAFEPIRQQLKRDLKDWEVIKKDRSNSGKLGNLKRWNIDLYCKVVNDEIDINEAEKIAKHRKATNAIANIAVNVNGNVTVNDNVINKDIWIAEKKLFVNDYQFKEKICRDKNVLMLPLEKHMNEYISDQELKEDYKELKELKRHFINWLNKKIKENGSSNAHSSSKLGTSSARIAALKVWSSGGEISSGSKN